jgi:hypothetical protein
MTDQPLIPGGNFVYRVDVFIRYDQDVGWGDRVNITECGRLPVLGDNPPWKFTGDESAESAFIHIPNPNLIGPSTDPA